MFFDSLQTVRNLRLDRPDFRCARDSFLVEDLYCRRRPQSRLPSAGLERHCEGRPRTANRRRAGARAGGRPRGCAHAYRLDGSVSVQDDRAGDLHHQREQAGLQADGRDHRGECRETPRADGPRDGGDGAADAQGDHRTAEQGAQRFGAADRCDGVSVRSGGDSQAARRTEHQPRASAAAGAGREPGRICARAGADSYPRRKRRRYPVPNQRHFHAGGGDELRRNFQPALRA